MRPRRWRAAAAAGMALMAAPTLASELRIQLSGREPIATKSVSFTCDANAPKLGLPAGPFRVEYLNGAGNSLAVLPIGGRRLIFANVLSASGARYAAQALLWSDGGPRGAFLSSDALDGRAQTLCTEQR